MIKANSSNQTQWTKELTGLQSYAGHYGIMLFSLVQTSDGAIAILGVDNPFYVENVFGSIYLAKTEPFLPTPSPSELPTPISTPTSTPSSVANSILNLAIPIIAVVIIAVIIISVLLFRRHLKTSNLKQ